MKGVDGNSGGPCIKVSPLEQSSFYLLVENMEECLSRLMEALKDCGAAANKSPAATKPEAVSHLSAFTRG